MITSYLLVQILLFLMLFNIVVRRVGFEPANEKKPTEILVIVTKRRLLGKENQHSQAISNLEAEPAHLKLP